jgi:hypothetical protein
MRLFVHAAPEAKFSNLQVSETGFDVGMVWDDAPRFFMPIGDQRPQLDSTLIERREL